VPFVLVYWPSSALPAAILHPTVPAPHPVYSSFLFRNPFAAAAFVPPLAISAFVLLIFFSAPPVSVRVTCKLIHVTSGRCVVCATTCMTVEDGCVTVEDGCGTVDALMVRMPSEHVDKLMCRERMWMRVMC
jgi:hypothetical protein